MPHHRGDARWLAPLFLAAAMSAAPAAAAADDAMTAGVTQDQPITLVVSKDGALVADLLKLLLKIRSRDINVASRLLARSDDIEALAAGVRDGLSILEGWRYEQFGRDAVDLVEGRLAFAVKGGRLKMTRTE